MAGGAAGPAGSAGTTGTTGATQQYNTGSNWANPVQGTAWQNPTTGSPYMGVGSQSPTGAMVYTPPTVSIGPTSPYGNLNDPANAAGRRQQAIDQSTQAATQATMNQQLPNSTGMGGYGYGPGYNPQGGFGYNPYGGGIAGLYGAMGMGGFGPRGFGPRGFNPYTTDIKPSPGSVAPAVQVPPTAQGGRTEADWNKFAAMANFAPGTNMEQVKKDWMAQPASPMQGPWGLNPQMIKPDSTMSDDFSHPRATGVGFGQAMNQLRQGGFGAGYGGAPTSFGPSYGK